MVGKYFFKQFQIESRSMGLEDMCLITRRKLSIYLSVYLPTCREREKKGVLQYLLICKPMNLIPT